MIGINGREAEYIIISSDTNFDNVIKFWKTEGRVKVSRKNQILSKEEIKKLENSKPDTKKPETNKLLSTKNAQVKNVENKPVLSINSLSKTKLNQEIQHALSRADTEYKQGVINSTAKVVSTHYGQEGFLSRVHNELMQMYPDGYLEVYDVIKPIMSKYTTKQGIINDVDKKSLLHNEIQQILSKANAGKDVVAYVPALVIKNMGEKDYKQLIYRSILQKFGQQKGLDVYKRIKNHI